MLHVARSARRLYRIKSLQIICRHARTNHVRDTTAATRRNVHSTTELNPAPRLDSLDYWEEYKTSFKIPKSNFQFVEQISLSQLDQEVTAVGFIGKRRDISRQLSFAPLIGGSGHYEVQLFAQSEFSEAARATLRAIPANSAVSVTGVLGIKKEDKTKANLGRAPPAKGKRFIDQLEIRVQSITCLNSYPKDLPNFPSQAPGPENRHLQIRFDPSLRKRLQFRSELVAFARKELADFQEVETPLLFKSTPEGAREFVVPTRSRGFAYGLPQSPQQYKQILMSSGIHRYVQFARCFRDEGHRADRQPEFTQIDLEMAWSDGEDVMQRVEQLIKHVWTYFSRPGTIVEHPLPSTAFVRMTYNKAMSDYGSDKPDLRIKGRIHRIDHIVPDSLRDMLTSISNPIIDAYKLRLKGGASAARKFVRKFLDSSDAEVFKMNTAGSPGVFVFDSRRPLQGLQAFGFEGAENLMALFAERANPAKGTDAEFEDGDVLLVQARDNLPHTGGSTFLGQLRLALNKAAIQQGLVENDPSFRFLWVTDFPLFTANNGTEPGQGGESGFSATHHPFTAPKTAADVDMLLDDPLKVVADHYDLVLNGIEIGGGSRRIHSAEMQKFIMRDILKINPTRIDSFSHLFAALRAGCPPHAGFAIGLDRLVAVMQGQESVRDVIAFPKDKNGRDLMVKSPNRMSDTQMQMYNLQPFQSEQRADGTTEADSPYL
ncbi:putative aspartyl-tRNA synthetase [Bisporella sp. PMI_857]|nr:putative aspartyl-tRNA synthetase [Bisporella sp. PMI_857]